MRGRRFTREQRSVGRFKTSSTPWECVRQDQRMSGDRSVEEVQHYDRQTTVDFAIEEIMVTDDY